MWTCKALYVKSHYANGEGNYFSLLSIFVTGLPENPLTLKWVNERPVLTTKKNASGPSLVCDRDYESVVLMKMRQAAERQRLIEEMMKEDND